MAQKFAIKSAVYGTLTNLADSEKTIDISYINVWELGASRGMQRTVCDCSQPLMWLPLCPESP